MSSSTYTVHPAALLDSSKGRMHEPRNAGPHDNQAQHIPPATPGESNHLSPFSSSQAQSNSTSPLLNNTNTPAGSLSALSEQYQSSDFASEVDEDPFFGVDFNNDGGTPSFLDDQLLALNHSSDSIDAFSIQSAPNQSYDVSDSLTYPLSPDQTPSIDTTSPRSDRKESRSRFSGPLPESISPQELTKPVKQSPSSVTSDQTAPQLTPKTSTSGPSSEDGTHTAATMPCPSPRVTVSLWAKDAPVHNIDSAFRSEADSPTTVRAGFSADDNFIPSYQDALGTSATRDELGNWVPNSRTGQRGLDPSNRPNAEVPSANELDSLRKVEEKNQEVKNWMASSQGTDAPDSQSAPPLLEENDGIPDKEIPKGHLTENKHLSGQTYYTEAGGEITAEDIQIMRQNRNWEDPPMLFGISQEGSQRFQPQSSQAAIERFERMCRDNDSVVSRAATWGTRRRSLPSIYDMEGITSGNFLKKLSISREPRKPSIFFKELRGLVRKPSASQILKRSRSTQAQDEETSSDPDAGNRRESQSSLAPPGRTMSWGKKQPMPSLNTALVNMGAGVASIGTTHARSGSISNATPVTSPKSPFNLQVKNTLRRPRSKSDLPKGANDTSQSSLVEMWKKTGGPPVAQLSKGAPPPVQDDDDDDDDDFDEDADLKGESTKMIEDIVPNFPGFQQHILRLNPMLEHENNYLVDRIAHQQIVRYKSLLNSKVKHVQHVSNRNCPCGVMCIALGGSATVLDIKGDPRGLDPLSTRYDGSDGDLTPLEGAINADSFPQDIPMPPTNTLPAEFECQLCYQAKKFQKPSDWTKHVHEDVQPFTCTWDRCRDPKIFKRKADWVRHENEGHRHLEWWTCDVDDCRHTCYRRDNFLQHLVREHKFPEPKVKTKAAIKRAGGVDPTWQKVEKCHEETKARPQDEPCRFCAKTFPTWKKLTVHLAKHMEQISLPILRLVARKQIEPDTIISPVQEPPPRNFAPIPVKREHQPFNTPNLNQLSVQQHPGGLAYPGPQQTPYGYQAMNPGPFQQPYYPQFDGLPHNLDTMALGVQHPMHHGFSNQHTYNTMPVTTGSFVANPNQYIPVPPNVEPFPAMQMNPLGLQDPTANQMTYDSMMDPSSAGGDQFTPHGSVSPYSHSPHQGQGSFYGHQ